jgi:hypothetical protein
MTDDQELKDVMAHEKRRGRRPVDAEYLRLLKEVATEVERAWRENDEASFRRALLRLGLGPGSPKYDRALKRWREHHGGRGRESL